MPFLKKCLEYLGWFLLIYSICICIVWLEMSFTAKKLNPFNGNFGDLIFFMMFLISGVLSITTFVFFVPLHVKVVKKRIPHKKKQFLISVFLIVILTLFLAITYYWTDAVFDWV